MIVRWNGSHVKAMRTARRDTQAQFAERLGVSIAVVSKWENRGTDQELLPKFAEMMDTAFSRLDAQQQRRFHDAMGLMPTPEPAREVLYAHAANPDRPEDAATKRREFLAFTGLALAGTPRWIGASDVALRRQRFARLQDLDHHLGGGDTFRLYCVELSGTEDALKHSSYSDETKRALTELAAEQAQQAGWAAFDAGHTETAVGLYNYSHWQATQGGNMELAANAMIQISYATSTSESVAAAETACGYLRKDVAAKAVAMLESRRAWSHAVAGDAYRAERALDRAGTALARGGTGPYWCEWMDETELAIMVGRVHTVLGQPHKAIEPFAAAVDAYPNHWTRDKALYTTYLAEAHLRASNIDLADELTETALKLASVTASVRPARRVSELALRLAEAGTVKGPSLRERTAALKPPVPATL